MEMKMVRGDALAEKYDWNIYLEPVAFPFEIVPLFNNIMRDWTRVLHYILQSC
jgi:hypothetical protein